MNISEMMRQQVGRRSHVHDIAGMVIITWQARRYGRYREAGGGRYTRHRPGCCRVVRPPYHAISRYVVRTSVACHDAVGRREHTSNEERRRGRRRGGGGIEERDVMAVVCAQEESPRHHHVFSTSFKYDARHNDIHYLLRYTQRNVRREAGV